MTYRAKRKTKNLIASFVLLFALGLSAIATTYAWFAVTKLSLMETDFVSGEMGISVTSVTAYKYVYPVYEGTTMINYDSPSAAVQTSDVTGVTNSDNNDYLHLNKLDTMQIYLDNNASSDITETAIRPKITGQKTSLLLKIIFTAVNTEDVTFLLKSTRSATDNFDYSDVSNNLVDTNLLASNFVSFTGYLDPDLTGVTPGQGQTTEAATWEHFRTLHSGAGYTSRRYYHQDANSHGTDLDILNTTMTKNANTTPVSHSLYLFVDYEPTHINPYFMRVDRIRHSYHLTSDFTFTLLMSSEVAS